MSLLIHFSENMIKVNGMKNLMVKKKNQMNFLMYLPSMPPLQGYEKEAKQKKGLKILTPNKLLITLTVILAQKKAVNNSYN